MPSNSLALADQSAAAVMIQLVEDTLTSPESKRAYHRALVDFLTWYRETGQRTMTKATVQRYVAELQARGLKAGNINGRLSAIRRLAAEASDNGAMPEQVAAGIKRTKGIRSEGHKTGNWLDRDQAQAFINLPEPKTLKGKRDRALLGLLVGTGLRRSEAARLTVEQIQQREGRWVLVDLLGKRNKTRTVPVPAWVKDGIDTWTRAAGLASGAVFRPVNRGDRLAGDRMTSQAIYVAIKGYAERMGLELAAHDTRRTFAKLAHKGGAQVDQIQLTLGHESLATTQRYLGLEQDLSNAPCDHLGIRLEARRAR
jgi:site-specific recombinase XerD